METPVIIYVFGQIDKNDKIVGLGRKMRLWQEYEDPEDVNPAGVIR